MQPKALPTPIEKNATITRIAAPKEKLSRLPMSLLTSVSTESSQKPLAPDLAIRYTLAEVFASGRLFYVSKAYPYADRSWLYEFCSCLDAPN